MNISTATPPAPRDLPVWEHALASLRAGEPVALLCVLDSRGSSPGRQGFKMSVTAASLAGSIGGGIMEHKFVETARALLLRPEAEPLVRHQIHRSDAPADRSGLICSGEQWLLVLPLRPPDLPVVQRLAERLRHGDPGRLTLSAASRLTLTEATDAGPHYTLALGPAWQYSERLGFRDHATIVGGGHVGLALSRTLATLEFDLTVLDNRPDLNTHQLNPYPHQKRVVNYETLAREIAAGPHQYVILMTFGYRTDLIALRQLLTLPLRYLGVMGSASKIAEMLASLRVEGISADQLARVHAPIGLPIHSRTPEEIAISIAAELIRERNAPPA